MPGGSVFCRFADARRVTALATATAFEPGCFRMPIACTGSAVRARVRRDVVEAVLDERDVLHVHGRGAAVLRDDDVAQRVEVGRLADARARRLAVRPLSSEPPGTLTCCFLIADVMSVTVDAGRDELVGVDPDADVRDRGSPSS